MIEDTTPDAIRTSAADAPSDNDADIEHGEVNEFMARLVLMVLMMLSILMPSMPLMLLMVLLV